MKKESTNKKYTELVGMARLIASKVGCKPVYVRQVLDGYRTPKSDRAIKAQKVIAYADMLRGNHPVASATPLL